MVYLPESCTRVNVLISGLVSVLISGFTLNQQSLVEKFPHVRYMPRCKN